MIPLLDGFSDELLGDLGRPPVLQRPAGAALTLSDAVNEARLLRRPLPSEGGAVPGAGLTSRPGPAHAV